MSHGAHELDVRRAPERVEATCETCRRSWTGAGRKRAQRAVDQAQAHVNITGHRVELAWTNRP